MKYIHLIFLNILNTLHYILKNESSFLILIFDIIMHFKMMEGYDNQR
uniref:Uncharacterized protein n=1 Tax=Anguilla anguilla TaxID=7936 RepID=A0A0E9XJW2_ANGAN